MLSHQMWVRARSVPIDIIQSLMMTILGHELMFPPQERWFTSSGAMAFNISFIVVTLWAMLVKVR